MKKFGETFLSDATDCSYLEARQSRFENFFALELSPEETDLVLSSGWRKFGPHFFRPLCGSCRACTPLRVLTQDFAPSKEQRRVLKGASQLISTFGELEYDPQYFKLYQEHSLEKFKNIPISSERDFFESFFIPSTPALVHRIEFEGNLIAAGLLDIGTQSLSSVYFFYDPKFSKSSLGTLSALREIDYARLQNIPHYYLGYYIEENKHMRYKARFSPHQLFDWYNQTWK